jgi:methylated-DNA-[protein]-cysteine S-methyltransferase
MHTTTFASPLGPLHLAASDTGLTRCTLRTVRPTTRPDDRNSDGQGAPAWLELARRELDAYFAGTLRAFTVPVDLSGVAQPHRRILAALSGVGYGRTTTYGALATELGLAEDGPRTVGGAMARNPVWIVVPCHRVLGAGGALTGYAGGLPAKRRLLDLEAQPTRPQLALTW